MNDLNAFNVYLSDCHTECNANDCCERVAAYKQKTSKRYVCRLSLESKRWNELSFVSCKLGHVVVGKSGPLVYAQQICQIAMNYSDCPVCLSQCGNVRWYTQWTNEFTYRLRLRLWVGLQRFVVVTTDYVSNHSIYFNLTAEVLGWTWCICRKTNGRFFSQHRNMQNHQQTHGNWWQFFLSFDIQMVNRMCEVESIRATDKLRFSENISRDVISVTNSLP